MPPKLLAIECATDSCSIALIHNDKLYQQQQLGAKQHSTHILQLIDAVLNEANINLSQLSAIAFGCGPGSFTGVRLAVSVVQGLAFAQDLPVIPVSSLQILAQSAICLSQAQRILACFDARRDEIYYGEYENNGQGIAVPLQSDSLHSPEIELSQAGTWQALGSGWDKYQQTIIEHNPGSILQGYEQCLPTAGDLLTIAKVAFAEGKAINASDALPVYLRNKVTG